MPKKRHRRHGKKEWTPSVDPEVVNGWKKGQTFRLEKIPLTMVYYNDFKVNLDLAYKREDPVELYQIDEYENGHHRLLINGQLLWFPSFRRAGIGYLSDDEDGADWTDAMTPLDALELWVAGEMTG